MAKTGIGVRPENRCEDVTKTGRPCGASKAILTRVDDGRIVRYRVCLGHLTKRVGAEKIEKAHGFKPGGAKNPNGRPRKPSVVELLRFKAEEEYGPDAVLQPLFDSLEATRAVVVGNGPSARVEVVGDMTEARKASNDILDRIYGKPRQAMELTGTGGGPIVIEVPTDEERAAQVAKMLALTGGLHAPVGDAEAAAPTNGSSNGHRNGNG